VKTQRSGIALTQASQFSEREKEVIELLLQGASNKEIARALYITESTVESHLTKIYAKLGVRSRAEAIIRLRELGKTPEPTLEDKPGESIIEIPDDSMYSRNKPVLQNHERQAVAKKISLEEIIRFLVTYKIPIFIWALLITVIVWAFLSSKKTAWTYEREGEYPDEFTVGLVLQRSSASAQMVHGQFGTIPAWPAQAGYVKYNNIKTSAADHLFLKLRYSKYSSSSVPILVYLDDELAQRAVIMPTDQGSWDKFVWTDVIDLGRVDRGVHAIKFYTDGQVFGVADLDKFILTTEPP
jgi:DNA-binding CsgD family transcriptional regulator